MCDWVPVCVIDLSEVAFIKLQTQLLNFWKPPNASASVYHKKKMGVKQRWSERE